MGLGKILSNLQKKSDILVGIFGNGTQATIGAAHEYGTNRAGRGNKTTIPQRSFLRKPMMAAKPEIVKQASMAVKWVINGGDYKVAMNRLGLYAQGVSLDAFQTSFNKQWTPLKASTIARRTQQSSKPLIDTGALRRAVVYKVVYKN